MDDALRIEDLPFWSGLSARGRATLAGAAQRLSFESGQQLIARGDEVAGAYFTLKGALRIYYVNAEGREGTLYWVDRGQPCILALNCAFLRLAYPAWAESDGPSEALLIPGGAYRELFSAEPSMQQFTFEALSARLFELMTLVEETASRGLESRMAAFLLRRSTAEKTLDLTQEQIANHLSTSREVVSRILRALSRAGLIEARHAQIRILDEARLRQLAG